MRTFMRNYVFPVHPLYLAVAVAAGIAHGAVELFVSGMSVDLAEAMALMTTLQVGVGLWLGDRLGRRTVDVLRWILGVVPDDDRWSDSAWQFLVLARFLLAISALGVCAFALMLAWLYILSQASMQDIYPAELAFGAFLASFSVSYAVKSGRLRFRRPLQTE